MKQRKEADGRRDSIIILNDDGSLVIVPLRDEGSNPTITEKYRGGLAKFFACQWSLFCAIAAKV